MNILQQLRRASPGGCLTNFFSGQGMIAFSSRAAAAQKPKRLKAKENIFLILFGFSDTTSSRRSHLRFRLNA
jgi:hypothetical protein